MLKVGDKVVVDNSGLVTYGYTGLILCKDYRGLMGIDLGTKHDPSIRYYAPENLKKIEEGKSNKTKQSKHPDSDEQHTLITKETVTQEAFKIHLTLRGQEELKQFYDTLVDIAELSDVSPYDSVGKHIYRLITELDNEIGY